MNICKSFDCTIINRKVAEKIQSVQKMGLDILHFRLHATHSFKQPFMTLCTVCRTCQINFYVLCTMQTLMSVYKNLILQCMQQIDNTFPVLHMSRLILECKHSPRYALFPDYGGKFRSYSYSADFGDEKVRSFLQYMQTTLRFLMFSLHCRSKSGFTASVLFQVRTNYKFAPLHLRFSKNIPSPCTLGI